MPGADSAHLGDVREADQVGDDTDGSNEELPAVAEESGVLVHQGRDEALHSTELWGAMKVSHPQQAPAPTHTKPDPLGEDQRAQQHRDTRVRRAQGSRSDLPFVISGEAPSLWASVSPSRKWRRWLSCSLKFRVVEHSRGLKLLAIFSGAQGSNFLFLFAPRGVRLRGGLLKVPDVLTWLSMPSISSIEKKRMAQRGEMGSWVTASG